MEVDELNDFDMVWAHRLSTALACLLCASVPAPGHAAPEHKAACAKGEAEACALDLLGPRPVDAQRFAALTELCERKNLHACAWVGVLHHAGEGTPRDSRGALTLLERGCKGGIALACATLGRVYDDDYTPRQVQADAKRASEAYGRAFELSQRACKEGQAQACADVADQYWRGKGTPRNDAERWRYQERACELGLWHACENIGTAFWKGAPGIETSLPKAAILLLRACELGTDYACRDLLQVPVDHLILHPTEAWPDRKTLDAIASLAERELKATKRPESTHAALAAVHLLAGRPALARAAFERGLELVSSDGDGVKAPYAFGIALSRDAMGEPAGPAYERFIELVTGPGSRPWLMLPRAQGVNQTQALEHARARSSKTPTSKPPTP